MECTDDCIYPYPTKLVPVRILSAPLLIIGQVVMQFPNQNNGNDAL